MVDETNQPNEFQGDLRIGHLNFDELHSRILIDCGKAIHVAKKRIIPRLYVSCRSQYKNPLNYIHLKDANFSWLPDSF